MIKSIEIENYKNFKHLKMENFKLINFFTGQNDTGKTNLLEALYINTGLCDSAVQVSLPPEHMVLVSEFRKIKLNNDNLKKPSFTKRIPLIPLASALSLNMLLSLLLSNTPHKPVTAKTSI
ncbi:hypothetical protein BT0002_06380 [Helicobacter pylori]